MKCRTIQMQLSEYLQDELDEETSRIITTHLDICAACRIEYEHTKMIFSLSTDNPLVVPFEHYWTSLLPRIRAKIDTPRASELSVILTKYLMPTAAAIVIILTILRIGATRSINNLDETQYILQQVPETELQEYLQKQSVIGIHETNQQMNDSVLSKDDGAVVSDLLASDGAVSGYVDDDPVIMYETISDRTANEIVSIISNNNL
jgi:hypothetical protein